MPISHNHTKFEYPDYIAPLPADDLVKIALKKQELYDQGVAQVQSQVDAYTDLRNNIYTDVEKAYFDETMAKYVTAINSSAGLDFSKKANLNAVLNIGKPLEKDKNIINAIQNGKEIQRRQKSLNELDQTKRSASNDWFYMNDVQDYLNSNQLGISLSKDKAYTEFYDISDKVMEYVKTLSKEQQNEFFTDTDGTPKGYIQKISQQGFNQTELATRIKGMLATDPKAMQQLTIDARYNFNQLGKDNAYVGYIEDQTLKEAAVSTQLQDTQNLIAELERSNARIKSPAVEQRIKSLKQNLVELTQYNQQLKINSNKTIDQFNMEDYFQIYENKFITNLSNTYATQKISRDLKDDKVWDNLQKMNLEYYKSTLDINKEKAKTQMASLDASKLLEQKVKLYKLYNIDPEDVVNVPNFFAPTKDSKGNTIFNFDDERVTVGALIDNSQSVVDRVPLGGPKMRYNVPTKDEKGVFSIKPKELTQKEFMQEFFKSLSDLQPNNVILVTTNTGETQEITAEGFRNLKAKDLGYISKIAISTPYSDQGETSYKERRKGTGGL